MLRMNSLETSESSSDSRYRNSETHRLRLTQEQRFYAAGYKGERIRKIS